MIASDDIRVNIDNIQTESTPAFGSEKIITSDCNQIIVESNLDTVQASTFDVDVDVDGGSATLEIMAPITTKSGVDYVVTSSVLAAKPSPLPPPPPLPRSSTQSQRSPKPQRLHMRTPPPPQHSNEEDCSIHRVPHRLGAEKPKAYEPNVISIGPYHYGKEHLKVMEVMKRTCFAKILETKILEYNKFENAMKILHDRVRQCYKGPIHPDLDHSFFDFIDMMIYDGCFIVRLIRDGYPDDLRKLERHIQIDIRYDLLLLENQLPFFLLLELDRIINENSTSYPTEDFSSAAFSFFQEDEMEIWSGRRTCPSSILHLLDLVYKCCLPSPQGIEQHKKYLEANKGKGSQRSWKFIRSSTGLYVAGINFLGKVLQDQDQDEVQGLFDITFTKGPSRIKIHNKVLKIPTLRVNDNTERMLRNLLVYEQFSQMGEPTYIYDYVTFMDNLIDTNRDVQLLCTKGVIESWLGDDEAVAQMFNKLRDKVYSSEDFYYAEIFDKVDKHCRPKWTKYKGILCKDYFSSPWSICAFVAAAFLLLFTALQTSYAFVAYYHPK